MEPYEFDLRDPKSWRNFPAPYLNPSIAIELFKIGGTNHYGWPKLRAVWGGKEQVWYQGDETLSAGWYFKYHLCFTPPDLRGYEYRDPLTLKKRRVGTNVVIPETVALVQPLYHQEEIGLPRWVIEIWRDVGDCEGYFKQEGYFHLLTVQREPIDPELGRGPYREIDEDILETLRGMVHFMLNTTEAQREEMRARDEEKAKEQGEKDKEAVWEDYEEAVKKIGKDNHL